MKNKNTLQKIDEKINKFIDSDKKSDKEIKTILTWAGFGIACGLVGKALGK